ncbi:MAG: hypothetical protein E6J67_17595 [Deltaproteobacteria bacterium]|nr:MAG: hypothetical protein E6J67_17595 [Deltaproteobacteria bacterium]
MSTLLVGIMLLAQAGAGTPETPPIQLHGFIDAFYALNANRPFDGASFLQGTGTTARRADELSLNAAALDIAVDPAPVGLHLTLAFGTGTEVLHAGDWRRASIRRTSASRLSSPRTTGTIPAVGWESSHRTTRRE